MLKIFKFFLPILHLKFQLPFRFHFFILLLLFKQSITLLLHFVFLVQSGYFLDFLLLELIKFPIMFLFRELIDQLLPLHNLLPLLNQLNLLLHLLLLPLPHLLKHLKFLFLFTALLIHPLLVQSKFSEPVLHQLHFFLSFFVFLFRSEHFLACSYCSGEAFCGS